MSDLIRKNDNSELPVIKDENFKGFVDENGIMSLKGADDVSLLMLFHQMVIENRDAPLSKHSVRAYKSDGKTLLDYMQQNEMVLSDLKEIDILSYVRYVRNKYALRTAIRKIDFFKRLLKFGFERNFFVVDYSVYVKKPKSIKGHISSEDYEKIYMSDENDGELLEYRQMDIEEAKIVLSCFDKVVKKRKYDDLLRARNRVIGSLLLYAGLRSSEIINLRFKNFNVNKDGDVMLRVSGKGRKERKVPMREETLNELSNYKRMVVNYFVSDERKLSSVPLLFSPFHKEDEEVVLEKMSYNNLYRIVKESVEMAGENAKISPHWFRHTYITQLLQEGVPLLVVRDLAGHANISTTDIYADVTRDKELHKYVKKSKFGF